MPLRGFALLLLLVTGLPSVACPALSHGAEAEEFAPKAAFLYNFALFTDWPAEARARDGQNLILCVLGKDPFGPALGSLEGKPVRNRKVAAEAIQHPEQAERCHVVFISSSEEARLPKLVEAPAESSALTVSDMDGAVQKGVMISMSLQDRKVVFDINHEAAKRARLALSLKLLRPARNVY
jgi:hypothetical protein